MVITMSRAANIVSFFFKPGKSRNEYFAPTLVIPIAILIGVLLFRLINGPV